VANKRYAVRFDSVANTVADIRAAFLDYYGAYHVDTNPLGVAELYYTSPYWIFTCAAIADKPIRIYIAGVGRLYINTGSGYTSGNDVDGPVAWMGTSTSGAATEFYVVLGPRTALFHVLQSLLLSKVGIIGQLTNGDYAVLGMIGSSTATYNAGALGLNTTDGTPIFPVTWDTGFQSAAGKLYTQPLILRNGVTGVELNGDGSIASFQDLANAAFVTANNAAVWGATFVLTVSGPLYMDGALPVLRTCLLMEYEAEED
jgi:hypothetical protein